MLRPALHAEIVLSAAGAAVQSAGQPGAGLAGQRAAEQPGQHAWAAGQPHGQLWGAPLHQPGLQLAPHQL